MRSLLSYQWSGVGKNSDAGERGGQTMWVCVSPPPTFDHRRLGHWRSIKKRLQLLGPPVAGCGHPPLPLVRSPPSTLQWSERTTAARAAINCATRSAEPSVLALHRDGTYHRLLFAAEKAVRTLTAGWCCSPGFHGNLWTRYLLLHLRINEFLMNQNLFL